MLVLKFALNTANWVWFPSTLHHFHFISGVIPQNNLRNGPRAMISPEYTGYASIQMDAFRFKRYIISYVLTLTPLKSHLRMCNVEKRKSKKNWTLKKSRTSIGERQRGEPRKWWRKIPGCQSCRNCRK